jgi:hypothetical protein
MVTRASSHLGWRQRILLGAGLLGLLSPVAMAEQRDYSYIRGQNVSPVYDGFEIAPDGSYVLWFSYFNRNSEERLEIPVGPSNMFEPGPADRGQPTHFLPLRRRAVFKTTLPKEGGPQQKLTWTLTAYGKTERITATLIPAAMIDHTKSTIGGEGEIPNLPPAVKIDGQSQTITLPNKATFTVSATDDGYPKNPRKGRAPFGMTVEWAKYRGPANGTVTFSPPGITKLVDGKATTTASFSEPGDYVLLATVEDGSVIVGTYCCWVNTEIKVTVKRP